jgi:putative OPT family oligopeptide transporter
MQAAMRKELTLRGLLLGGAITLVFTAANVYLGLKVGLTFATSIPAAVISMAVLRTLRDSTIWENNIVQTVASAAGTLSSIIFVLPGLVMVGWWTGFPFWESFAICAVGGILGVMYSVPLRRALVTYSDLPYPEGVAAAEVLRVGTGARGGEGARENAVGLVALVVSSIVAAAFQVAEAIGVFASTVAGYVRLGVASATGIGFSMSLALVGAGHLIGLTVGVAIFVGLLIAWAIAVPVLTALHPAAGDAQTVALAAWANGVRFIGTGTIGFAAIWTLAKLVAPVTNGITSALAASRARKAGGGGDLPIEEQDMPIGIVLGISLVSLVPIAIILWAFIQGTVVASMAVPLIATAIVYIVIAGFFVATATGYMAGLIGSSSSPVSGMAIISVIGAALLLLVVTHGAAPSVAPALIAYALCVTALLLNVATISNNNLQDLKTGQLVGATPWRQQASLIVGVIFGAIVIPPVLNVLGASDHFGSQTLPAPQATLISTLAKGVIQGQIDWSLITIGVLVGIVIVALDELGRITGRFRLPPLAVGLGIYLPSSVTAPLVLGTFAGTIYNRWVKSRPNGEAARRLGVLIASGLIVGESIWGVIYSGVIFAAQRGVFHVADPSAPLTLIGSWFASPAQALAGIAFVVVPILLYRWIAGRARSLPSDVLTNE